MPSRCVPLVGIPTCVRTLNDRVIHGASDRYTTAVIEAAGCLPILIPAVGAKIDICMLLDKLDGLLLTGSPSNVEPTHYGGTPSHPGTLHDPERDATTLPLIREAVSRDMPVLAICRGIQELNVALGGSLHQRVHELPGRLIHRPPKVRNRDQAYAPAHGVALTAGGVLTALFGAAELMVNSLHSQAVDRPAPALVVEAVAPDGVIEGVSLPEARFVVGVQWHPEYRVLENPHSRALFGAFARACHTTNAGISSGARAA